MVAAKALKLGLRRLVNAAVGVSLTIGPAFISVGMENGMCHFEACLELFDA